jgi:allophanate hydrolase
MTVAPMTDLARLSLDLHSLARAYAEGITPIQVVAEVERRIAAAGDDKVWIGRDPAALKAQAEALAALPPEERAKLPLYGVPFAVNDNIDVAGLETTAACKEFAYRPDRSATVVERLVAAGALVVGKTNLDQFATGLVGVRSPYGVPRNPFDPRYVPGGSSSGSAVAVAAGLVSFSLGTDTAGSGRVPAGINNIVGLKPTCGALSTTGVVPACRSLDSVSIFALTCADAEAVLDVAEAPDAADAYSRASGPRPPEPTTWRVGVPRPEQRDFQSDAAAKASYEASLDRLKALGATLVEIDVAPFLETAKLLYGGAWVAERLAAIKEFAAQQPDALLPVTRQIILGADKLSAVDAFQGLYKLRAYVQQTAPAWQQIDALAVPTAPTSYTVAELEAEPIKYNSVLGIYTNFVNLLDLSAVAVPASLSPKGLPIGLTLIAPAWHDRRLLALAARFHASTGLAMGATGHALPAAAPKPATDSAIRLAVFGAHLQGQPLNHELTNLGAVLVGPCRTALEYRMYALANPPRPGLIRVAEKGEAIGGEIWAVPADKLGIFVNGIRAPLGVGTVHLADGTTVLGFICEGLGAQGCADITRFGDWRSYKASLTS